MIKRLITLCVALALVASPSYAATKKPTAKPTTSAWPPKGFKANGEIYAKIPSAVEMISIVSANKSLASQLAQKVDGARICEKFSCGVVQFASLNGCLWWEVNAKLIGPTSATDKTTKTFGTIRTTVGQSKPKSTITVLLVSQELLGLKHSISNIAASCHHDAATEKIPSTQYQSLTN